MKLKKFLPLFLILCACQATTYNLGEAGDFLPSKKLLEEGIVNKYYVHEKKQGNEDISTYIDYRSYQVENNNLLYRQFNPDYSLVKLKSYSFEDNQMILLKESQYWKKDTFLANISEPIEKSWASQTAYAEKEIFYKDDWKSVFRSMQERNTDTTFLNKPSRLFEGKTYL